MIASPAARVSQAGLTLMELLVASFIGLLAIAGILYLYESQHRNMITQGDLADLRMNGQFTLNEAQYYLTHAGLGLPPSLDHLMISNGDMVVKMNPSKRSAAASKNPSSSGTRVVYGIAASDSSLFSGKSFAVALAGTQPIEAGLIGISAYPGRSDSALVSLQGNEADFSSLAQLYPLDRVRLHLSSGSGSDTAAGDFHILKDQIGGRMDTHGDSLLLAEDIDTLAYSFFLINRADSVSNLPASLDSLQSVKIKVVARTHRKDVRRAGDGYQRQTLTAQVNYRRSI